MPCTLEKRADTSASQPGRTTKDDGPPYGNRFHPYACPALSKNGRTRLLRSRGGPRKTMVHPTEIGFIRMHALHSRKTGGHVCSAAGADHERRWSTLRK